MNAQSPADLLDDPLAQWMLPLFLLGLLIEFSISYLQKRGWYQTKDTVASLSMLLASAVVDVLPKLAAIWLMLQLENLSPLAEVVGRQWWAWVVLFFLDDLCYYLFHRSNHECRLLWAGHVNHHSARHMNFATALRQGVFERVPKYVVWLPLPLLGFDVAMVLTMISLNLFYQFWIHTPAIKRLPAAVEWVFNTPSHHRVHHASNPLYLDRNHGGVLIVWDRLFGTFQAELDTEKPTYGLTKNLPNSDPWTVLTHEYRKLYRDLKRAANWRDRLGYLFGAPGWSHDGPNQSAAALRAGLGLSNGGRDADSLG